MLCNEQLTGNGRNQMTMEHGLTSLSAPLSSGSPSKIDELSVMQTFCPNTKNDKQVCALNGENN